MNKASELNTEFDCPHQQLMQCDGASARSASFAQKRYG